MKIVHAILLTAAIALSASACSDDNITPDPCADAKVVAARFKIEELVDTFARETDTALTIQFVRFSALEKYDSYEWKIGYDERLFTDSTFTLNFALGSVNLGERLPIRFIGKRAPRVDCFPYDDGIDTLVKSLVIVSKYESPILGLYRGVHLDEPADSFDVHIFWKNEDFLTMTNINRGCADTVRKQVSAVYKELGATIMTFDANGSYDGGGCEAPEGVLYLSDDRSQITVDYRYGRDRTHKVFVGRRIGN